MYKVFHYQHWSSRSSVVVATSQVLGGGYEKTDAEAAAQCFVPVAEFDTEDKAIEFAKQLAIKSAEGRDAREYQCKTETLNNEPVLFAMQYEPKGWY
jgi:hypothetical protein